MLLDLRVILSIIYLIIALAWLEPLLFIYYCVFFILGWIFCSKLPSIIDKLNQENRRKSVLLEAKIYLSPYKSIWKNLKLSNKHCYLKLGSDGVSISGKEKVYPYRRFKVITSYKHDYIDLWEMFCKDFSHNITYSGLLEMCDRFKVTVYEEDVQSIKEANYFTNKASNINLKNVIALGTTKEKIELLDVNNCSEIELTALPGISIVMAKKAIKKREEIGGFKSIEDFFIFMKLKPHMESQLRDKVCVNKMCGTYKKIKRNQERSVDL